MATTIFVVWGSTDEGKRERLILALRAAGFAPDVGGAFDAVLSCPCLAIWSRADATGAFGRLAGLIKAASDGRLISVLLEATPLPVGLASHPVVDLSNWRGSRDNPAFSELVGKLKVAAQDCAPKTVGAAVTRRMRRLLGGVTVLVVLGFAFAFTMNVLAVQNNLCSINFVQPNLSDICGSLGLGGKPEREERLAWEGRALGSCDALRTHIQQFPNGALRSTAADMIDGRRTVPEETWVPDELRLPIYEPIGDGFADRATAEADARVRATAQAMTLCEVSAAADIYRLQSAGVTPDTFICDTTASGSYCGFDGKAVCTLERLQTTNTEFCGEAP